MNTGFDLLKDMVFWYIFISLGVLIYSISLFNQLETFKIKNIFLKISVLLFISLLLAFSISLFSPIVVSVYDRLTGNTQTTQFALATYSAIATLIISYSLSTIGSFDKRNSELREKINELDNEYKKLLNNEQRLEDSIDRNNLLYKVLQTRTTSFLLLSAKISEIDAEKSDSQRHKFMSLKLLQIMLSRNDLNDISFDLDEIKSIIQDSILDPSEIPPSLMEYLNNLISYLKMSNSPSNLVEKIDTSTQTIAQAMNKTTNSIF